MAWNHKSRVVAVAIAIQPGPGQFTKPNVNTDLLAVGSVTNTHAIESAEDPTATGTAFESNRVYLGKNATLGGTIPLRGPGGNAPPVATAWVPGRLLQAGGFTEIRKAAASNAVTGASTAMDLVLANTESAADGFLVGAPISVANFGAGNLATTFCTKYVGNTRTATVGEAAGGNIAANTAYTIPAYLSYVLGTLTGDPVYLSVSIWRDKKRYDYRDFQPSSLALNMPVANEANTAFPDLTFQGKALIEAIADDVTPALPSALLQLTPAPVRGGKFFLNRIKLGHQSNSFTINYTVAGASNQNQAVGQDNYDVLSANRQIALDLNQMAVADFDLHAYEDQQTKLPVMSSWGSAPGNRFAFIVPNLCFDPFSPGDRNGYVSLTGNAYITDVDKSAALTIWW